MDKLTFTKRKVSSFMFTGTIGTRVNIDVIFDHLPLDNVILGMKCNNKYKGDIKQTSCFFNQINFNTFLPSCNAKINLKLFSTGSFQAAGAKSEKQVNELLSYLLANFKDLVGEEQVKVVQKDGFLLNYSDYTTFTNKEKERFKNIKIYNNKGEIIGYKNGKTIFFGEKEIVVDKDFGILHDIVRNSFVKNVYNKNGEIIGDITYNLVSNKNLKRIQINRSFIIEKASDYEVNYYKMFYKNKEKIKTLYFTKKLTLYQSFVYEHNKENDIFNINVKYKALNKDDQNIKIKLSNMNDIFYFDKNPDYYLDHQQFIKLCSDKYNIKIYHNNTAIKLNVITIKLYLDKDLKTVVEEENCSYKFSILYYTLYNKIVISGLQDFKHVEIIEKIILNMINDLRKEIFIKIKKFDDTKEIQKISLSSLL